MVVAVAHQQHRAARAVRGLRIVDRIANHECLRGRTAEQARCFQQRHRVGLAAREKITAMHASKVVRNAQHAQQIMGMLRGLVGDAGQWQARRMQLRQALRHARIQFAGLAIDALVMLLVAGVRAFVQGIVHRAALPQAHMQQGLANEVGRTLAHGTRDEGTLYLRPLLLGQHAVERQIEVAQRIHQGAIQIKHYGLRRNGLRNARATQANGFAHGRCSRCSRNSRYGRHTDLLKTDDNAAQHAAKPQRRAKIHELQPCLCTLTPRPHACQLFGPHRLR